MFYFFYVAGHALDLLLSTGKEDGIPKVRKFRSVLLSYQFHCDLDLQWLLFFAVHLKRFQGFWWLVWLALVVLWNAKRSRASTRQREFISRVYISVEDNEARFFHSPFFLDIYSSVSYSFIESRQQLNGMVIRLSYDMCDIIARYSLTKKIFLVLPAPIFCQESVHNRTLQRATKPDIMQLVRCGLSGDVLLFRWQCVKYENCLLMQSYQGCGFVFCFFAYVGRRK